MIDHKLHMSEDAFNTVWGVIKDLYQKVHPRNLTPSLIAERSGYSRRVVYRVLLRLEDEGVIERRQFTIIKERKAG